MTTDTDKLVEMARECGGQQLHGVSKCIALSRSELAAFASAHIASLCGDVELVELQHMACSDDGELRWMSGRKATKDCELYAMPDFGRAPLLYPASTVAALKAERDALQEKLWAQDVRCGKLEIEKGALKARVAELEKDAARGRLLLKWLRDGRIPGPAWGRPIKLVETCPQFGDETEVKNIGALLDAALTKGQP